MRFPGYRGDIRGTVPLFGAAVAEPLRLASLHGSYPLGAADIAVDSVVCPQHPLVNSVEGSFAVGFYHGCEGVPLGRPGRRHVGHLLLKMQIV